MAKQQITGWLVYTAKHSDDTEDTRRSAWGSTKEEAVENYDSSCEGYLEEQMHRFVPVTLGVDELEMSTVADTVIADVPAGAGEVVSPTEVEVG